MLVLTRKVGQRIVVPQCELIVTVLAVQGSKVQLGFSAPADVDVFREERWPATGLAISLSPQQSKGEAMTRSMNGLPRTIADRQTGETDAVETLAAELTEAAYFVALRHGVVDDTWIDMKLDLWEAMADTVRKWLRELPVATMES
jgi:carbon storage regulator CsrA